MKWLKNLGLGVLITVIIAVGIYGLSWIITCGLIKLITVCFGWTFKWHIATGIWLLILIAKGIFSHSTTVNNK